MVKVVKLISNHHYTHHADDDRDIIFGTDTDDWISGDSESDIYGFYWPAKLDEAQIIAPSKGNWGRLIGRQIESHGDGEYAFAAVEVNMDGAKPIAIDEYIDAGGGVDVVHGQNGNDWIYGGEGGDFLWGEWGEDVLMGGAGDDFIDTGVGMDSVNGGSGNDTVNNINASGGDFLDGGADYDKLRLERSSGAFTFDLMTGVGDVFAPGQYFNAINFEELVYVGSKARDDVKGGDNRDNLKGMSGNDNLEGRGGNDEIDGGTGSDVLNGGAGNDRIFGGAGKYKDFINGMEDNDELHGGDGDDVIHDGDGDDTSYGEDGNDTMFTGKGNDTVYGGAGNDTIMEADVDDPGVRQRAEVYEGKYTSDFNDVIYGEGGSDTIYGGSGYDAIEGGADNDTIDGGSGGDFIYGGSGIDSISGGTGIDRLAGGADKDFFNFGFDDFEENSVKPGTLFSSDEIRDFQLGLDKVNLLGVNHMLGGTLFFDDQDGTPDENGEIMVESVGIDQRMTVDFDGDGSANLIIRFTAIDVPLSANDFIL